MHQCFLLLVTLCSVGILTTQEKPTAEAKPKRWLLELKHINPKAWCGKMQFTPDGKELLAGDYPEGKIQLWNVTSGETRRLFEAGQGSRGSAEYFQLSPDGKTLYCDDSHERPKITDIKKGDENLRHWEMKGAVHAWNVETGEQQTIYQHDPPTLIIFTQYAPDGLTFFTMEEKSGEFEGHPPRNYTLWDVKTHQSRPLPDKIPGYLIYSPDSQTLAIPLGDEKGIKEIVFFDVKSLQVRRRQSLKQTGITTLSLSYSQDGKWLIAKLRKKTDGEEPSYWTPQIVIWNAQTGEEVFTHIGANQTDWIYPSCSSDHRYLVLSNWYPPLDGFKESLPNVRRGSLLIIDLENKKLAHQVMLTKPVSDDVSTTVGQAVIHPNGKVATVISRVMPTVVPDVEGERINVNKLPRAELHLIDLVTGKIIESNVLPSNYHTICAFSPDGKMLAIGAVGSVQLWNMEDLGSR